MTTELVVALIAGGVALISAGLSVWSSLKGSERATANAQAIERLRIENDRVKAAADHHKEVSKYSEPLAKSAYDLQSRIYNILKLGLIDSYLVNGSSREKSYVVENTAYLIAQYFCWTELARREIQFIDLGESTKTRILLHLQDDLYNLWGTDRQPEVLRVFAGEQRAIGEALIQQSPRGVEAMGYGAFLNSFAPGVNPLIDAVRADILSLGSGKMDQAAHRLKNVQNALIDLLEMLDPENVRFPLHRRSKIST